MELLATGLGHGGDEDRPFLVFGAEVRGLNLELLNEIRVRIDRRVAVAAWIGYVGAVGGDVQRVAGQAVIGIGVV